MMGDALIPYYPLFIYILFTTYLFCDMVPLVPVTINIVYWVPIAILYYTY